MHSQYALCGQGYITHLVFRKPQAAAELFRKSLRIRETVLGLDHPFTTATRAEFLVRMFLFHIFWLFFFLEILGLDTLFTSAACAELL